MRHNYNLQFDVSTEGNDLILQSPAMDIKFKGFASEYYKESNKRAQEDYVDQLMRNNMDQALITFWSDGQEVTPLSVKTMLDEKVDEFNMEIREQQERNEL